MPRPTSRSSSARRNPGSTPIRRSSSLTATRGLGKSRRRTSESIRSSVESASSSSDEDSQITPTRGVKRNRPDSSPASSPRTKRPLSALAPIATELAQAIDSKNWDAIPGIDAHARRQLREASSGELGSELRRVVSERRDDLYDQYRQAATSGDIDNFYKIRRAYLAIFRRQKRSLLSDGFSNLINFENINKDAGYERGSRPPQDRDQFTYIFPTSRYDRLTREERYRAAQATEFIQQAVLQAHEELITGNLAFFQGSGHFKNWLNRFNRREASSLTSTIAGSLIEYRTMQIIQSENFDGRFFGLTIDDQVKVRRISGSSDAIPDIELTTVTGKKLYIDITANSGSSVGHVLTKGGGALREFSLLAETTYPPIELRGLNKVLNPNKITFRDLSSEEIARIKLTLERIEELKGGLEVQRQAIQNRLRSIGATIKDIWPRLIDDSTSKTDEELINMFARLSGYRPPSFIPGETFFVSTGVKDMEKSIVDLNDELNLWWSFSGAEVSKTGRVTRLKDQLQAYIDTLGGINELARQLS